LNARTTGLAPPFSYASPDCCPRFCCGCISKAVALCPLSVISYFAGLQKLLSASGRPLHNRFRRPNVSCQFGALGGASSTWQEGVPCDSSQALIQIARTDSCTVPRSYSGPRGGQEERKWASSADYRDAHRRLLFHFLWRFLYQSFLANKLWPIRLMTLWQIRRMPMCCEVSPRPAYFMGSLSILCIKNVSSAPPELSRVPLAMIV